MLHATRTNVRGTPLVSALLIVAALTAGACDSSTNPILPDQWEADIAGIDDFDAISGAVGIAAGAASFTATIEIEGAEPESVFGWRVAQGSCEEPGNVLGSAASYPDLEADDEGEAAQTVNITAAMVATGTYHVHVLDESGDEAVVAACGHLSRQ
jgi:hypothetical protein